MNRKGFESEVQEKGERNRHNNIVILKVPFDNETLALKIIYLFE